MKNDLGWASLEKFFLVSHPSYCLSVTPKEKSQLWPVGCVLDKVLPLSKLGLVQEVLVMSRGAGSITPSACVHGLGMCRGGHVYCCAFRQPNW